MSELSAFQKFKDRLQESFQSRPEHHEVRKAERFSYIGPFCEDRAVAMLRFDKGVETGGGLYGYIDRSGETLVPFIYHAAKDFQNGLAVVAQFDPSAIQEATEKNNWWELIMGTMVKNEMSPKNPLKYGFIDGNGEVAIALSYEDADSFSEGLAPVRLNGQYHFVNAQNEQVLEEKYDAAYAFREGYSAVRQGDHWFFINPQGQVFFDHLFDEVLYPFGFKNGRAAVRKAAVDYHLTKDGILLGI
ncbi:MAG: WG repeat-containing protein [Bacteroidota bacterium]